MPLAQEWVLFLEYLHVPSPVPINLSMSCGQTAKQAIIFGTTIWSRSVKIGDLVRKRNLPPCHPIIGLVVKINHTHYSDGSCDSPTVRVSWSDGYGTFWTTTGSLEIISSK